MRSELRSLFDRLMGDGPPEAQPLPEKLVIYGAGSCGRRTARRLVEMGIEVVAFLDRAAGAIGGLCEGKPCVHPESSGAGAYAADGYPVLIALFNPETDLALIEQALAEIGFRHRYRYIDLFERVFGSEASDYWLARRELIYEHRSELLELFETLEDRKSVETLLDLIALRVGHPIPFGHPPETARQYLPGEVDLSKGCRLVDGGAFTGDTLAAFIAAGASPLAYAGFEPDPANFKELVRSAKLLANALTERLLIPCGLGAEARITGFLPGAGAASRIASDGGARIQVVSLDETIPDFRPTHIKLDIEGAEPDALRGAAATIHACRPVLAVSVYHTPDHLWQLPRLMRELLPECRLTLHAHQHNGFDTVVYAIPRERCR